MTWLWKWLADMPSTNVRIFVTIIVFIGTAIRYWWTGTPPDREWMIFISIMAGVDALQFGAKRATEKPTPPLGKDQEDTAGTLAPKRVVAVPDAVIASEAPSNVPPELKEPVRPDEIT